MNKPKKLGTYHLGLHTVNVFVEAEGLDGSFRIWPGSGIPEITVGLGQMHWSRVVEVFLHEVLELSFVQAARRFSPDPDFAQSHAGYSFFTTHEEFADIVSRVGQIVAEALPDLSKEFKRVRKAGKK